MIDEIKPVSRWREYGYASPEAACDDWNNLQAAHYACNATKGNKVTTEIKTINVIKHVNIPDGDW